MIVEISAHSAVVLYFKALTLFAAISVPVLWCDSCNHNYRITQLEEQERLRNSPMATIMT
jgi:uncharacterized membrane protein YesL